MTNSRIYERIEALGYCKNRIVADCADPKSIYELARLGLKINGSKKAPTPYEPAFSLSRTTRSSSSRAA
ncbi:hypothetical protein KWG61_10875 [Allobaculum sp. Allo2]|nr:hypothetical protein [Allobaculum sp. Allo2]UNT92623.1 hypothetical protein KWG61_10875 [Allobaculum sp. Allo2]